MTSLTLKQEKSVFIVLLETAVWLVWDRPSHSYSYLLVRIVEIQRPKANKILNDSFCDNISLRCVICFYWAFFLQKNTLVYRRRISAFCSWCFETLLSLLNGDNTACNVICQLCFFSPQSFPSTLEYSSCCICIIGISHFSFILPFIVRMRRALHRAHSLASGTISLSCMAYCSCVCGIVCLLFVCVQTEKCWFVCENGVFIKFHSLFLQESIIHNIFPVDLCFGQSFSKHKRKLRWSKWSLWISLKRNSINSTFRPPFCHFAKHTKICVVANFLRDKNLVGHLSSLRLSKHYYGHVCHIFYVRIESEKSEREPEWNLLWCHTIRFIWNDVLRLKLCPLDVCFLCIPW